MDALQSIHDGVLDIRASDAFPEEKRRVANEIEGQLMRVVRCELPPAHGANVIKAGALMLENMLGRHSTQVNVTQRVTLEALVLGAAAPSNAHTLAAHTVDAELVLPPAAQAADSQGSTPCMPTESASPQPDIAPDATGDKGGGGPEPGARPAPGGLPSNTNQVSNSLPRLGYTVRKKASNLLVDDEEDTK